LKICTLIDQIKQFTEYFENIYYTLGDDTDTLRTIEEIIARLDNHEPDCQCIEEEGEKELVKPNEPSLYPSANIVEKAVGGIPYRQICIQHRSLRGNSTNIPIVFCIYY
jgi:hypothetical protein